MVAVVATLPRIERVTLGDRVHEELRGRLIAGDLAPGEKLSLRALAESFGLSMMPVREAVTRLVADEALEVLPNRAVRVPVMTLSKFGELTRIRLAIEGFAVGEAALNRDEADLVAIRRHDAAFRAEGRKARPSLAAATHANKDLHFAIYRAAGLPALVPIIESLWLRIGPVLNLDMRTSRRRLSDNPAEAHHARMVEAVAVRDAAAARAALEADIRGAAAFIESQGSLPA